MVPMNVSETDAVTLISALVVTKLTLKQNAPVMEVWLNPCQKTNILPTTKQIMLPEVSTP